MVVVYDVTELAHVVEFREQFLKTVARDLMNRVREMLSAAQSASRCVSRRSTSSAS
ncbi:hypothetical protein [Microbacterium sp. UBA3394]|uniref:hypothetical protein n=1 Tax=Microbacterium sp. UBA3394 TaxID=1946945 RepID=UPI00258018E3|nr:hypothetical protein [Microbacterium sp. UBA3394]